MQYVVIILIFLAPSTFLGQTQRFFYDYEVRNPNNKESTKLKMLLDIDKDWVKFYDFDFLEIDSLNQLKNGQSHTTYSESEQVIMRKFGTNNNQKFEKLMLDYYQINSEDQMKWNITNETKKWGDYQLQKANTRFGGRDWTAWFCSEIPLIEGPYKFRGLPGLIVEIEDSQHLFSYKLIKSKKLANTYSTTDFLETSYGQKALTINLKQFHAIKLKAYYDPFADLRKILEDGGKLIVDNKEIRSIKDIETKVKTAREHIIKEYLPLELDKAIPYPNN